jgi:hypothetical protein
MPDGDNEYPPQFASSDLSALLGQINDFAGVPPPPPPPPGPMEMKSAKNSTKTSAAPSASTDSAKLLASSEYPVPVTIVGSQAQRGPYLPGLKDMLIAVTYVRLAEQITTPDQKAAAQKLAYELMESGNSTLTAHIAKQRASLKKR